MKPFLVLLWLAQISQAAPLVPSRGPRSQRLSTPSRSVGGPSRVEPVLPLTPSAPGLPVQPPGIAASQAAAPANLGNGVSAGYRVRIPGLLPLAQPELPLAATIQPEFAGDQESLVRSQALSGLEALHRELRDSAPADGSWILGKIFDAEHGSPNTAAPGVNAVPKDARDGLPNTAAPGGPQEGQAAPPAGSQTQGQTAAFLDEEFAKLRRALARGRQDIPGALQALEVIAWSRSYLDGGEYDRWLEARRLKFLALDKRLSQAVREAIEGDIKEGDVAGARERLEELDLRHPQWARAHEELLASLRQAVPAEDLKAEPISPASEPERLAELLRGHLAAGEFRQAHYLVKIIEKKHEAWARGHAEELAQAYRAFLQGVYEAFEARKAPFSPLEARRLREYASAVSEGRNLGYGFKQPVKQDPESLMCTIMSICNAFDATIGFADPAMNLEKFTELVRAVLGDSKLGLPKKQGGKGLSTHRVRALMKALGFKLKVIEMQERLRRPFREEELIALFKPGQALIPVFTIVQSYPDEDGLKEEEHKGFLRDAYFSPGENRMIYLMMDPLIGRVSFYSWPEMKVFLHKIFVIRTDKPLAAPAASPGVNAVPKDARDGLPSTAAPSPEAPKQ